MIKLSQFTLDSGTLKEAFLQLLRQLMQKPQQAEYIQLALKIAEVDLLAWLNAQSETPQFFWTSRKRVQQVAVSGLLHSWQDLASVEAALKNCAPELRAYGGWRFDAQAGQATGPWQDWPESYFFVPRWEVRFEKQLYQLCLNLSGPSVSWPQQLESALELLQPPKALVPSLPLLGALEHQPGPAQWQQQIELAQELFQSSSLRKLVLSRQSQGQLDSLPLNLMQGLLAQGREAYHIWFRPFAEQVLWAASPERLYARQGRTLWTEALAGTRPRPLEAAQQKRLQQELLNSHKEFEENERVRQHLEAALAELSLGLSAEPLRVIPAGPVQHLYRCLQASLLEQVSDTQLVEALHPTPAVSGYPSKQAVTILRRLENHDRGWYTGAIGWISSQAAEWAVMLRCALWKRPQLYFYTGAGIMPASEAAAEWDELNVKLSSLLALWQETSAREVHA